MEIEIFKRALRKAIEPHESALMRAWCDWNAGVDGANERFTNVWKDEGGIMSSLGDRLHLTYIPERFERVDAAYSRTGGCSRDDILVALEHENKISTAYHEVEKLVNIDIPLNVVVTYPITNKPKEERDKYLRRFSGILAQAGDLIGRHLIVFGILGQDSIDWSFHLFSHSGFTEL